MSDLNLHIPQPCDEPWDGMSGDGRDRLCSRCATTVYDLTGLTMTQGATLGAAGTRICVRARVDTSGKVVLPVRRRGPGTAAALAAVGLLTASDALASQPKPTGSIRGKVENFCAEATITATATDGSHYSAKANERGRYNLKHLMPDTYELEMKSGSVTRSVGRVAVGDQEAAIYNLKDTGDCILIGMIEVAADGG